MRAGAVTAIQGAAREPTPVDPLTAALREVLRGVLRDELAELRAELLSPPIEYRDRQQEAQRLGISLATLDRLCRDGLPFVRIGDSRRFRAAQVDRWIEIRSQSGAESTREAGSDA